MIRIVRPIMLAAGVPAQQAHPHTLRHTFGRLYMSARGAELSRLQRIMGHGSPETTSRYVFHDDVELAESGLSEAVLLGFVHEQCFEEVVVALAEMSGLVATDIERMLERHPDVAQAAVVPIDDAIKGQKPVAFVVPKPGRAPGTDDIKQFALAHAPAYAHPRFVWFVDDLPLATTNKVDRVLLRRQAELYAAVANRDKA